jgi:adenylate cyclase
LTDSFIINELYQRKMFRIAVGYLAVAWVLWQVVDTTCPTFECSLELQKTIFWLLLGGLPVTLAVAWVNWKTAIIVGIAFMAGLGVSVMMSGSRSELKEPVVEDTRQERLPNSVAVLPLDNLSPDPDNAYFAAGIHEEILNHLAKLSQLNVISRTSMIRYADSDLSIPKIAEELNVGAVMEGSVRYANERVLVTMQLIDPDTDAHLWSQSYNRDLADVFAIQADIAMNVANALRAEFSIAEQQSIEAVPTNSPAAYALYLRAISVPGSTESSVSTVTKYLDEAIRLDPNFAAAYAYKAGFYASGLTGNFPNQQAESEQITVENAEQALALDPALGLAHVALAFVHQAHWRWGEAEQSLEEALRLSPNNSNVLSQYSRNKRFRGDFSGALTTAQKAQRLDPQNLSAMYQLGIAYFYVRDYVAAANSFGIVSALTPDSGNFQLQIGLVESARGNRSEAMTELQHAERLYGAETPTVRYPQLAMAYAQIGRQDEVNRLSQALQVRAEDMRVGPAAWALMYIALEDYDQALDRLEIAVNDHDPDLLSLGAIKANPFGISVLEEPRFQALRDQIGN